MAETEAMTNENLIAIWSKAVDTQMHFNEMSVKSRQLGLTFVTAALALAVVLISQGDAFAFKFTVRAHEFTLHVSILILLAAILGLIAVRTLDLEVYHRMLRGAVTFGEDFEQNNMLDILKLTKGMTQAISHYSRYSDAKVTQVDGKYDYRGYNQKNAEKKIRSFYCSTIIFLVLSAVLLLIFTNI